MRPHALETGTWSRSKSISKCSKTGVFSGEWVAMLTRYCTNALGSSAGNQMSPVVRGGLQPPAESALVGAAELHGEFPCQREPWPASAPVPRFLTTSGVPEVERCRNERAPLCVQAAVHLYFGHVGLGDGVDIDDGPSANGASIAAESAPRCGRNRRCRAGWPLRSSGFWSSLT